MEQSWGPPLQKTTLIAKECRQAHHPCRLGTRASPLTKPADLQGLSQGSHPSAKLALLWGLPNHKRICGLVTIKEKEASESDGPAGLRGWRSGRTAEKTGWRASVLTLPITDTPWGRPFFTRETSHWLSCKMSELGPPRLTRRFHWGLHELFCIKKGSERCVLWLSKAWVSQRGWWFPGRGCALPSVLPLVDWCP